MAIGYCPTNKEIQFHGVDYRNTKAIRGLLKFKHKLLPKAKLEMNTEVLSIYVDIEEAMKSINISKKQKTTIEYYSHGYTEEWIGEKLHNNSKQAINQIILMICDKISKYLLQRRLSFEN